MSRFRELRRVLPPVYWTVWLGTLINRAGNFVVPLLTFYLIDERGLSMGAAGAIVSLFGAGGVAAALGGGVLAINGLLIVFAQPAITARIATLDRSRVLLVSALLAGLGLSLHGVGAAIAIHALAVATWTFAEILGSPTTAAVVSDFSTARSRGRYQGVFTMSWGLASFLGPLVGPFTLERAGPGVAWGGCLVVGGVAAIGLAATTPRHRPTSPT